ncbi:MAG: transcription elongation factor GreA [Lachnospiraceae bacterium]|nr:transcription elongation factor GreA [Lachnospiraceae bacterium]
MKDRLTESDIKKMEKEIEYRKVVLRPELLEHVKVARAHGDLSENFEYKAAKQEKNRNESRIRYLERMIKTAIVIDDGSADDEVGINNMVTVEFEDDHSEEKYKIVTTIRSDSLNGLISIDSPMGKALMHKKKGDRVLVSVNENISYYVCIKDIDKTTDDSNDKLSAY